MPACPLKIKLKFLNLPLHTLPPQRQCLRTFCYFFSTFREKFNLSRHTAYIYTFTLYWFCSGKYLEFNQREEKIYSANLKALDLEEYVNQLRTQDSSEKREVVDGKKGLRRHSRIPL